jgi:hypothetical protein
MHKKDCVYSIFKIPERPDIYLWNHILVILSSKTYSTVESRKKHENNACVSYSKKVTRMNSMAGLCIS